MPGGYSSYDTFTIGTQGGTDDADAFGLVAAGQSLPVLARIPRVAPPEAASPPEPARAYALDQAHAPAAGPVDPSLLGASIDVLTDAGVTQETPPAPGVRIDRPYVAPATETPTTNPAPATSIPEPTPPPLAPVDRQEGWMASLLRFETAIAPYTNLIVLLTLTAAAGLTLLLLRGGKPAYETPPADEAPGLSITQSAGATPTTKVLTPPQKTTPAPSRATATGPASIATARPIEPHRETAPVETPADAGPPAPERVALQPPYPTTRGSAAQRPMAKLTERILPAQPGATQTR